MSDITRLAQRRMAEAVLSFIDQYGSVGVPILETLNAQGYMVVTRRAFSSLEVGHRTLDTLRGVVAGEGMDTLDKLMQYWLLSLEVTLEELIVATIPILQLQYDAEEPAVPDSQIKNTLMKCPLGLALFYLTNTFPLGLRNATKGTH